MQSLKFNEGQFKAITHLNGPMMVVAGPGSGKTTVITYRVKHLIENYSIPENKILVVTFTKSAADEMKIRYEKITNKKTKILFSTFHSLFFRILRSHININLENVLKESEKKEILLNIIKNLNIEVGIEDELFQSLNLELTIVKNNFIDIDYYNSTNFANDEFKQIYSTYEKLKKKYNKIDFDDMLIKCYELLSNNENILKIWQNRFSHILIDEFQDINKIQYETIKLLAQKCDSLYIVGDDDQSIYKFRGAKPEFLINFKEEYNNVETSILNVNYRSTEEIINISNKIISQNNFRLDKKIVGTGKRGVNPKIIKSNDIVTEAVNIAKKIKSMKDINVNDICVIYRNNLQSRAFIEAFMNFNIPYQLKDEVPLIYEHWICKDICAYINCAINKYDNESLKRIINKPKRYINKGIISYLDKNNESLLYQLLETNKLKNWQKQRIEELEFYFNSIKKKTPYDAFKYIRKVVDYNSYVKEYSKYKRMNYKNLFEILDELQETSKGFKTLEEYLEHVKETIKKSKEENSKKEKSDLNGVTLTTMHSVKGLEFEVVFVISCVENVIPHEKAKSKEDIEEERRLFYVAVTRAKSILYISIIKTRYEETVKPTIFLNNIIKL